MKIILFTLSFEASGSVIHLAKKNGDSDDGKVYALKGVTKPNFIQNERKVSD